MPVRIIDLSLPIDDTLEETHAASIDRISHAEGVEHFNWVLMNRDPEARQRFERGERWVKPEEVADGELLSLEIVHASVHMGTHVDAPFHYGSRSEGKPAKMIEDIPLEWCMGEGVRLDFTSKKFPDVITAEDIARALDEIGHTLKPGQIVLLWTGGDKLLGTPDYVHRYVGCTVDAVEYLLDRGIKMLGIDTIGLDRPCFGMFQEFLKTRDPSLLWPCHVLGRRREYCHMERLGHLEDLPGPTGFTVCCFPVRVRRAGAGFSRVVALVEEPSA